MSGNLAQMFSLIKSKAVGLYADALAGHLDPYYPVIGLVVLALGVVLITRLMVATPVPSASSGSNSGAVSDSDATVGGTTPATPAKAARGRSPSAAKARKTSSASASTPTKARSASPKATKAKTPAAAGAKSPKRAHTPSRAGAAAAPAAAAASTSKAAPVSAVPGIGTTYASRLATVGISTVSQLASVSPDTLDRRFAEKMLASPGARASTWIKAAKDSLHK